MPHISHHKLSKKTLQELEERTMLFLSSPSTKTRQEIFRELFTETERVMIGKRLAILYYLSENKSLYEVSEKLRVSPSTVQRFDRAQEKGRFKYTDKWLKRNKEAHKALRVIAELVAVPFEAQRKSLARLADES